MAGDVTIRRATAGDVDWLVALLNGEETEPFLSAAHAYDRDGIAAEVERSGRDPRRFGRFVIEVDGERAGVMGFEERSERHRIAHLGGLAVHPAFRGRGIADEAARLLQRLLFDELGFHRLELEIYAFNERACAHAERSGFVREGRKRKAYLKDGEWVDSVLYALIPEDLD